MASDQRIADRLNTHILMNKGQIPAITDQVQGEKTGDLALSGLNTNSYTNVPGKTWFSNPALKMVAKVINADMQGDDALLIKTYVDGDGSSQTWVVPGTVIEDCEDDWDGTNWTVTGQDGDAGVTNKIVGTNAIELDIDGSTNVDDFIFEATGTLDLSGDSFISLWITSTVDTDDGDFAVGISTNSGYSTGITEVDVPGQAANTTVNHILAITGVAAVESVGLTMKVDPGDGTLYIDDVRMFTTAEKAEYASNLIDGEATQGTIQVLSVNSGDAISDVTSVATRGGAGGDDIEIRLL